jgi:hypothetical protein
MMKLTMEVDCTPEEARRFLGLPDVTRANEIYVEALANAMKGGGFEQMQEVIRQVAPMGQLGMKLFQQFIENSTGLAGKGAGPRKTDH